jgi:hypothetical protein
MKTVVNVARYHLVDRFTYIVVPWALLAFIFEVNLIIVGTIPQHPNQNVPVGGLSSFFIMVLVLGVLSTTRSLPFGLSRGVSRRSYFFGPPVSPSPWRPSTGWATPFYRSWNRPRTVGESASSFSG